MSQCPCGSQKTFSDCCEAIIKGEVKAETAEKVMRARYSAFSTGEVDFIVSSQHPESREEVNREEIQTWSSNSEWQGLEILGTHEGGEADKNGKVEFVAKYVMEGKLQNHHELADFKKEGGEWFFVDGQMVGGQIVRTAPKLGRNDPCSCGSGKKFKKCCG